MNPIEKFLIGTIGFIAGTVWWLLFYWFFEISIRGI
jgi:hypothetical protein